MANKENVMDGFLGDLPEDIQNKVMTIHKIVVDTVNSILATREYSDLNNDSWAKEQLEEFCAMPTDKSDIGAVRVYQKGKKYKCMIQVTGHFTNHMSDFTQELMHEFIKNVFITMRPKIRKKFDVTLSNEGDHGNPFEGLDIYTSPKVAEELWNKFVDNVKTIRTITESNEYDEDNELYDERARWKKELQPMTHDNLHHDFRAGFDYDTGNAVKIVYSLDNIKVDDIGSGYVNWNDPNRAQVIDDIQKNIAKKGNMDHKSHGQKVLAIIDRVTGNRLKSIRCLGPHAPCVDPTLLSLDIDKLHEYYNSKGKDFINKFVTSVRVGDIDNTSVFKTSKWMNNDTTTKTFRGGVTMQVDNTITRRQAGERLKYGRGAKIDDLKPETIISSDYAPTYNHPSKKDIKKNPELYNKESYEYIESTNNTNKVTGNLKGLPKGFRVFVIDVNQSILDAVKHEMQGHKNFESINKDDVKYLTSWMDPKSKDSNFGYFEVEKSNDKYSGEVQVFPQPDKQVNDLPKDLVSIWNKSLKHVYDKKKKSIDKQDSTKHLTLITNERVHYLTLVFTKEYAKKFWNFCQNPKTYPLNEAAATEPASHDEYNVDMSEKDAKRVLGTLTQSIINDKKPVTQYTANIYANVITKNLLPIWSKGYRKFSITLKNNSNDNIFEFKVPNMTQDFVSRFIAGRESINGLLHRNPEIKIIMSPSIFNTMKDRNDGYNFFKAAIKYYDSKVESYSEKLMFEVMKLNSEMKRLLSTSKLSGIVTCPMMMLFSFDNVDMSNNDAFRISKENINAINKFVRGIYSNYADPSKERKQIVDDLSKMIQSFKESLEMDDNLRNLLYLPEAVDRLMNGGFDNEMNTVHNNFIHENTDLAWPACSPDPEVKYLSEKFGVKKLKKIPADLIAYIQIETESIRDANDKMMIASYCISKIEIVEWYIELLDVGSKKYIVPHNKPYLENVRTQLLECYKKIMATPIPKSGDRPIIDIKYPKGYEG